MDFDKIIEQYGVLGLIAAFAAYGLYQRYLSRIKIDEARELHSVEEDTQDEKLDNETREITNKLALQAFNIQERLQRLQAEYEEQGKMVKSQAARIVELSEALENERVAKAEYHRQVDLLVNELANSAARIKQLETDILILESTMDK